MFEPENIKNIWNIHRHNLINRISPNRRTNIRPRSRNGTKKKKNKQTAQANQLQWIFKSHFHSVFFLIFFTGIPSYLICGVREGPIRSRLPHRVGSLWRARATNERNLIARYFSTIRRNNERRGTGEPAEIQDENANFSKLGWK